VRGLILRRLARLVITLFVVTFLTALMLDLLPGDPALAIAGADFTNLDNEAQLDEVRARLGLNEPVPVRYAGWLANAATGDLGESFRTRQPVADAISERMPVTLQLLVMAQVLAMGFALVVAPIAALRPGRWFDRTATGVSFGMLSTPAFIGGLILIYLFAVRFGLFPAQGYVPLGDGFFSSIRSLFLPAVALAAPEAAVLTRILRTEMITTLGQDYILIARAKGLPTWYILTRHALRPSSLPLVTLAGLSIGGLIGGAVIVETLFALPGIGRLAVDSIGSRDFVMVQGIVAVIAVAYVVVNFMVDLAYAALDPRIRHGAA